MDNDSGHDDYKLRPCLRPVEAIPVDQGGQQVIALRDPTGLAAATITVSGAALFVLSLFDGQNHIEDVRQRVSEQFGQPLEPDAVRGIVDRLDEAYFLDGPRFERHYEGLLRDYRNAPTRVSRDSYWGNDDTDDVGTNLSNLLKFDTHPTATRRVIGLFAPHIDYARGRPCYRKAYAALAKSKSVERFVLLGTNHFGRSSSVVATGKDFETALGTTECDVAFLEQLETRCGDLRRYEYDHQREHSIELQVLLLQHMFGVTGFRIVPILCPDPCGPTGTAPYDGKGIDLQHFAETLRELLREDPTETVIIAAADFSHVGQSFGKDPLLSEAFLNQVEVRDREVLQALAENNPQKFLEGVSRDENPTRVCSAGCMYALMVALPHARGEILGYHQAVHRESQNCVTCAAVQFLEDGAY